MRRTLTQCAHSDQNLRDTVPVTRLLFTRMRRTLTQCIHSDQNLLDAGATPAPGPGGGARWTPAPLTRSCRPRRRGCGARSRGAGRACAVGAAGREMHLPAGGHLRVAGEEHGAQRGRGVPAAVLADVSGIVTRVVTELTGKTDQLDGLRRIGIDEIAYRKGHRYLTCMVDHDTGRLVWAHEGRNKDTLSTFFQALGESRSAVLTHVSADGAEWIHAVVKEHAPQAVLCLDPYHVVAWVTKALDKVRRRTLEQAGGGDRNARWAVIKNPGDLTDEQQLSLARIKRTNTALYRAYLLKEQLRAVFALSL